MKVLLIPEQNHFRDWIGKTYYDILMHYKKYSKNEIEIIWTDQFNMLNKDIIKKNLPDIIIFFGTDTLVFANKFNYIFETNIPIFACCHDLFYFDKCINCSYIQQCNGILHFSKASKLLTSYQNHFPNKYINTFKGRFINTNKYKNYNLEKKYDILIFGSRRGENMIEQHQAEK